MGRIGRSFQLVGQSYRLLMQDRELMILPLMSGMAIAAAIIVIVLGFGLSWSRVERRGFETYLVFAVMYVATYAIAIFFQAAVVAGASERMRGGDPTVGSALAAAGRRAGPILMWAVLAATVGLVLRASHERVGFVGRILASLLGAAWSLATMFVVPVLVLEDRPIAGAFTRSMQVFKQTWGEAVVGGTSLGVAAVCLWVTLIAVVGLLAYVIGLMALVVFGVGAVCLMILFSALNGVYLASLYR